MVMPIAVVAYEGVLADESEAFRDVLSRLPGARMITVGEHVGVVGGPGGAQLVQATFDDVDHATVVVVPGGLGTHRHPEIARWLRHVHPRWVLTSSTGSALLAAAGLLRHRTAATHWLAGPLLERHGVTPSNERLVVDGPFVTCAGLASTFDAAYVVVRAVGGPMLELSIREALRESANELPRRDAAPGACPSRSSYRPRGGADREPRPGDPTASGAVEIELEETPAAHPSRRRRRDPN